VREAGRSIRNRGKTEPKKHSGSGKEPHGDSLAHEKGPEGDLPESSCDAKSRVARKQSHALQDPQSSR
jgi:hypothetical protein